MSSNVTSNDDIIAFYHGEYQPLPAEFLATGIFGIMLYSGIIVAVIILQLRFLSKTLLNRLFYVSLIVMAIFELPRYAFLIRDSAYNSTVGYGMHIISGIFYFVCLAIIGITFANILELGSLTRMIYGKRGLSIAIMVHSVVDLSGLAYCLQSHSLRTFFASHFYRFFIIFDIVQNLAYSSVLMFFGLRLICRYDKLGRFAPSADQRMTFQVIVRKVTTILALISCFALIRLSLLCMKFSSIHNSDSTKSITTYVFSLFGFLWFMMSDFLPRGGSAIALAILMQQSESNNVDTEKRKGLKEREDQFLESFDDCFKHDEEEGHATERTRNGPYGHKKIPEKKQELRTSDSTSPKKAYLGTKNGVSNGFLEIDSTEEMKD